LTQKEVGLEDTVAIDAKRILLRYGAPIAVMDRLEEGDRIALAREISRTSLPDRGAHLQDLLVARGLLDADVVAASRARKGKKKKKVGDG
jgi:ribose 1,5-bisphosphokinase PhnN